MLVLNLDLALMMWESIVVYPGEFVPGWEWEDEAGVVHKNYVAMAGEAMQFGPVVLSWPDVEASSNWDESRHESRDDEFAHKLDMQSGDANGLSAAARRHVRGDVAQGSQRRVRGLLRAPG